MNNLNFCPFTFWNLEILIIVINSKIFFYKPLILVSILIMILFNSECKSIGDFIKGYGIFFLS